MKLSSLFTTIFKIIFSNLSAQVKQVIYQYDCSTVPKFINFEFINLNIELKIDSFQLKTGSFYFSRMKLNFLQI